MNEKEEELMKVIMRASVGLIQTYNSGLSEQSIKTRMARIASDLVYATEEI